MGATFCFSLQRAWLRLAGDRGICATGRLHVLIRLPLTQAPLLQAQQRRCLAARGRWPALSSRLGRRWVTHCRGRPGAGSSQSRFWRYSIGAAVLLTRLLLPASLMFSLLSLLLLLPLLPSLLLKAKVRCNCLLIVLLQQHLGITAAWLDAVKAQPLRLQGSRRCGNAALFLLRGTALAGQRCAVPSKRCCMSPFTACCKSCRWTRQDVQSSLKVWQWAAGALQTSQPGCAGSPRCRRRRRRHCCSCCTRFLIGWLSCWVDSDSCHCCNAGHVTQKRVIGGGRGVMRGEPAASTRKTEKQKRPGLTDRADSEPARPMHKTTTRLWKGWPA